MYKLFIMFKCIKLAGIISTIYHILSTSFISVCVATRETSKIGNILTGNITGDLVPSAYPVLKINQSANNDSSFHNYYKRELNDIESETIELMNKQRKIFEELRKKLKDQNKLFSDLSMATQMQ